MTGNTKSKIEKKHSLTVLQVLPHLESGGVERGTIDIARGLVEHGHNAIVVSHGGRLTYQITSVGALHIKLPVHTKNPLRIWLNIFRLKRIIKKYQVDIVHARSRAPAWSAYFAAKSMRVSFVTTFHGVYAFSGKIKRWYNSIMTKGDRVIAVSHYIKEHINENYKINPEHVSVIHRGIDTDYFSSKNVTSMRVIQQMEKLHLPDDKPIVLLPGRFARWKGHDVLLKALARIPKDKFFCLMIGDYHQHQKYKKELERSIRLLDLGGSVRIIGHSMDMPAIYSLSSVVVSASTSQPESFGRIPAEAQAMGKLVVATRHGGACETVIDKKTGWLVEPGDDEEMAKVINMALDLSATKQKTMSKSAIKHIEDEFSLHSMIIHTLDVYYDLLGLVSSSSPGKKKRMPIQKKQNRPSVSEDSQKVKNKEKSHKRAASSKSSKSNPKRAA